jgi:hypothetical protein
MTLRDKWKFLLKDGECIIVGRAVKANHIQANIIQANLEELKKYDMIVTIQDTNDSHFRDFEVPERAKQQMAMFRDKFQKYLPCLNSEVTCSKLETWLKDVMELKLELLISQHYHKIGFVPPGTLLDPAWMDVVTEEGDDVTIKKKARYRVGLCLVPALLFCNDDTKWAFDDE